MPEITDAELRQFVRYQNLGTPDEVEKKVRELETDNKKQRDEMADLKKLPKVPEGGRIVTKEEASELDAFRALGKPEEVKGKVEKVSTLEGEIAKRDRESKRDAAAKAMGLEGKDLGSFAGIDTLTFDVREQEVDKNGKKEKVPVAYVKDAEGKEQTLEAYGKEKWGRPFETLISAPANNGTTGTKYTTQTGGTGTSGAYDPAAEGKKMAEEAKAGTGEKSLAFR